MKNYNQNLYPIIIPSYEPDNRLLKLLENLTQKGFSKIILVNDGSSSDYDSIFNEAKNKFKVEVINHHKNLGKGAALKTAFSYCLKNIENLCGCITADSDGQHSPDSINDCILALVKNPKNLIMGVRNFYKPGIPKNSLIGNFNTNKIIKKMYKKELTDTQTGLRGLPADFMNLCLNLKGNRFEYEMQMLCLALENDIQITEVPIETIYDSQKNHATHFRPIKDTLKIYRTLGFFKCLKILCFTKK